MTRKVSPIPAARSWSRWPSGRIFAVLINLFFLVAPLAAARAISGSGQDQEPRLGGVKVYAGKAEKTNSLKLAFNDMRHRSPVYDDDQLGSYVLRTPEKEIWFEAYIGQNREETYYLTVVEKQRLEIKAALLPAEEIKRELDAKGHVALYINFDFDKADIRPESQLIIDEIVKLLKNNPALSGAIEGHTDDVGAPDYKPL